MYNRFRGGDVNPGKVISLHPPTVAIASNMRRFSGDFPILKIITTKLPKEDLVLDKVIPTVALYSPGREEIPFWMAIFPVPVVHGTNDKKRIAELMSRFSQSSLDNLDEYISLVESKKVGIYRINASKNDWSDYQHVRLHGEPRVKDPKLKSDE